jgi:hypothetical protein
MARGYQIADEPQPGPMASVAVQPFWPLLGVMFGGSWLSWPWFIVNSLAVGSPTRRREVALAIVGFVGNAALVLALGSLLFTEIVPETFAPYLVLVQIVWRLGVSYWLYVLQARTFGIYEYYGGPVRNGLPILIVGYFAGRLVIGPALQAVPFLRLVLA